MDLGRQIWKRGFEEVNLGRQIWGGGFGKVGSTLVPLSACWQGLLLECRKEARDGSSGDMQGGLFGQLGSGCIGGSVGTFLLVKPLVWGTQVLLKSHFLAAVLLLGSGWHPLGWRWGIVMST